MLVFLSMNSKYKHPVFRVLRVLAGIVLLILGFIGLFLPVLQGILFLIAGTLLLAVDIPFFRGVIYRLQKHIPHLRKPVKHARKWLGKHGKASPPKKDNP